MASLLVPLIWVGLAWFGGMALFLGGSSLDMKIRSAVPFLAWILFAAFFVWGTQRLSVITPAAG